MKIGNHYISWSWGDILISKNKSFEYQIEFGKNVSYNIFQLSIEWSEKKDHSGLRFVFTIKKLFFICFCIYDHRHWDRNNDCWIKKKIS